MHEHGLHIKLPGMVVDISEFWEVGSRNIGAIKREYDGQEWRAEE